MKSDFATWMTAMGYNGKQVAEAGELIGMGRSTALLCYRGERRLRKTERLAMAAIVCGCPLWSLKFQREMSASGKALPISGATSLS